ncbi:MAG: type II toxin-antitoxin system VapB family antitoxin [Proteobacteria bacterium]|nr:type II toxin-antitoxin system VapB family antitoxin [Pseudomonadota bacterium]
MFKTTVVLDEDLLKEAVEVTGARSKKEAIEKGLKLLVREHNKAALRDELGTFDLDLTPKELERLRDE